MEFAIEFLQKFVFLAVFAGLTFGLGTIFPRPMKFPALERLIHLNLILLTLAVFGGLVIGILAVLVMFTVLGAWMKYYYFLIVALYFFRFIQITGITRPVSGKIGIMVTAILALLSGSLWAIWPNWVTYDITALVCGYVLISAAAPKRVGLLLAIFVAVLAYDVWGVLGSPAIGGGAIVQVVGQARNYFLPVGVILTPWGGMLGLGDVVIPGLVVMLARRYELVNESVFGWTIGLLILFFILAAVRTALPATIVLIPTTLGAFLFAASQKKVQLQWS